MNPPTAEIVPPTQALEITVRAASGTGRTSISAFDAALHAAGVANLNLIPLSSVIPPGSRIRHTTERLPGGHGERLYCVLARAFADEPGRSAWAGLGWVVDEAGNGLFVEHTAESEECVLELIHHSLEDMTHTRGGGFGEVHTAVSSARCVDRPACALVVAAYAVVPWGSGA